MALPAWLAATVQLPAATKVRAVPLTVHTAGVLDANVAGRPELAFAIKAAGAVPSVWLPGDTKVMVCAPGLTTKDCTTAVAALKLALPAWLAVMVQVPTPTSVALVLATVQTAGVEDTRLTASPELALATKATGVVLKAWLAGAVKLSVCAAGAGGSLPPPPPPPQAASKAPTDTRQADHKTRWNVGFIARLSKVTGTKPAKGWGTGAACCSMPANPGGSAGAHDTSAKTGALKTRMLKTKAPTTKAHECALSTVHGCHSGQWV